MALNKIVPTHLYPSLKPCVQTDKCTDIPLYILVALDIFHHTTKLHPCTPPNPKLFSHMWIPLTLPIWPKMHTMTLPLWLPQVHPISCVPIKHCLKLANKYGEIWCFRFTSIGSDWHCLLHCPCNYVGSACCVSIAIAYTNNIMH